MSANGESRSHRSGGGVLGQALPADEGFMVRALELASRGRYRVAPNPLVGALIVKDGEVLAEGFHRQVGAPHAEAAAFDALDGSAEGATLYVTLEPCSHHGRTPPCVERVLDARISRIVCAIRDPNPDVSGRGLDRLGEAGLDVVLGVGREPATELNLPFLISCLEQRPLVTLKWAMSLDGKIATRTGESQWISSPEGRAWALALREEHDAILVGSETAIVDDARLDRRLGLAPGPNVRVVLDRRLRLSPGQRLFEAEGDVLVFTESDDTPRRVALEQRGAEVIVVESVDPPVVLERLFQRGVNSVLVEGGGTVIDAFVRSGRFDRVAICCAPKLIGGREALTPVAGLGVGSLVAAPVLESLKAHSEGPDIVLEALRKDLLRGLLEVVDRREGAVASPVAAEQSGAE